MAVAAAPQEQNSARLAPVETRYAPLFCFGLLVASCALASFALACATPFAAFAVIAAAMLSLPLALVVVTGAWLVNQTIGFGFLHYPIDASTIAWGFVIGAAALAATATAKGVLQAMRRSVSAVALSMALSMALVGAYAAYEIVLFAATPFLGGAGSFTVKIVGYIGLLSVFWTIGLVAACEITKLLGAMLRRKAV